MKFNVDFGKLRINKQFVQFGQNNKFKVFEYPDTNFLCFEVVDISDGFQKIQKFVQEATITFYFNELKIEVNQ